jgi:hypothetical protein
MINASIPCQIYKNKIPFCNITNGKTFLVITGIFFFTHFYIIVITQSARVISSDSSSEQSTIIKLFCTIFFVIVFPEYFLLPFLALWFPVSLFSGVSVRIQFLPFFLPPVFLCPSLREKS